MKKFPIIFRRDCINIRVGNRVFHFSLKYGDSSVLTDAHFAVYQDVSFAFFQYFCLSQTDVNTIPYTNNNKSCR